MSLKGHGYHSYVFKYVPLSVSYLFACKGKSLHQYYLSSTHFIIALSIKEEIFSPQKQIILFENWHAINTFSIEDQSEIGFWSYFSVYK